MKIIAGLGNPGFRYRNTRHNVGFKVLDAFSKEHGIKIKKRGYQGIYGTGSHAGEEIILFKPHTYMNLSGIAVKSIYSSYLDKESDLLIVTDDFNLPFGRIRIKDKGSAGGHNGLKSIIGQLGPEFHRVRLGVADGVMPDDRASYVLAPFPRKNREIVENMVKTSVECVESWISKGVKEAMALYNGIE